MYIHCNSLCVAVGIRKIPPFHHCERPASSAGGSDRRTNVPGRLQPSRQLPPAGGVKRVLQHVPHQLVLPRVAARVHVGEAVRGGELADRCVELPPGSGQRRGQGAKPFVSASEVIGGKNCLLPKNWCVRLMKKACAETISA